MARLDSKASLRGTEVTSAAQSQRGGSEGFSVSEMLAVVAIIGLMVLITTPAMLNFFSSMRVRTASHKMMSHMRLCRQMAVSRRTDVLLKIQADGGSGDANYHAWEERNSNLVRNPNGADTTANTEDDERLVIKTEKQFVLDKVLFPEVYDDPTPVSATPPGTSVMDSGKIVLLRFRPNGQVARLDTTSGVVQSFTLLRVRLERRINGTRKDVWDATLNQAGKVGSDFTREP